MKVEKDQTYKNTQEVKKALGEELNKLLPQLPWKHLSRVIRDIKPLRKAVISGGRRIKKSNRIAIHKILERECLRHEMFLHIFFSEWFNEQKAYRACLEPFFQSEEHNELQKVMECNETEYVISEEYFREFIEIIRLDDIQKFLLLSPVCFTPGQKKQLEHLRDNQEKGEGTNTLSGVKKEEKDTDKQAGKISFTKGEWKYHKNELKKCQETIEKLKNDNIRLLTRQKNHNTEKTELKKQIDICSNEHAKEKEKRQEQKETLQKKITDLKNEVKKTNAQLLEKENRIRNLEKNEKQLKAKREKYFHQILSKLDGEELIAALNAPDDVLDLLSTVIRPPATDNDSDQPPLITLKDFWKNLVVKEGFLVRNILDVSIKEVANNKYFQDWDKRVDDFNDLKCSLSTRIYLTDMFHDILRQYFLQQK